MSRVQRVTVLMGGWSSEREISLVSGEACAAALEECGHAVTRLDVGRDLAARLAELRPEVCFNALHGRFGEDGRVQGLLDMMGIPYTHSGALASALAMDKPMAKLVFAQAGLAVPEGYTVSLGRLLAEGARLAAPFVVKPAAEGSSVGVLVALDGELGPLRQRNDRDAAQVVMVERYVAGRELTVAVLGGEALAVTEIVPALGFYDYRAKYTAGLADHVLPADLPAGVTARCLAMAAQAHAVLGCRGVSRADFRWDDRDGPVGLHLLELNTQPGMTPLSLVPEQAAWCGMSFPVLVNRLVSEARCDA